MSSALFRRPQVARALAFVALPLGAIPLVGIAVAGPLRAAFGKPAPAPPPRAELVNVPGHGAAAASLALDSLAGRSGNVRVRLLTRDEVDFYPGLTDRFGEAVRTPGIRTVPFRTDGSQFAFITLTPWRDKRGTFVNTYHVGWWPGERQLMPANYDNPAGFIEVRPNDVDLRVSTHFTLRDFITHDQDNVWPKYVVLREDLLDKLELVLATLESQGVQTRHIVVLSGFRSPQYNARAVIEGAAYASRHQYGDAADVIIDADGDGRMDDLNHDGVVNFRDTDVINHAVERVERMYPDLVGGLGLYQATGPRGPFAHIDVRGTRARWTNSAAVVRAPSEQWNFSAGYNAQSAAVGKCKADGAFAALCSSIR
jgi:hypothetical protein